MADSKNAVGIAKQYFALLDAGSPALLDLLTEDVQIYFPKFGIGRGKQAFAEALTGLAGAIQSVEHPAESFVYIQQAERLAVEGRTRGVLKSGARWAGGETPGGRFCNVFEFRGDRISRVHIYLDPDYAGEDRDRFLWGFEGRAW